jgi:uncharacterized membrane protein YbhN (UPF0104 family)
MLFILGTLALLLFAVIVLYAIHHRYPFRTSMKVPFANISFEATDPTGPRADEETLDIPKSPDSVSVPR